MNTYNIYQISWGTYYTHDQGLGSKGALHTRQVGNFPNADKAIEKANEWRNTFIGDTFVITCAEVV